MNSKTLTGLLLTIGPILFAITIFAGFPGTGGNEDWVTADYVKEIDMFNTLQQLRAVNKR